MSIEHLTPHITRIFVPFLDIYTSVFLVKTSEGALLFDTATYDSDMTEIILPALGELGVPPEALTRVFISHPHRDHAGGLAALLARRPEIEVIAGSTALAETHTGARITVMGDGETLLGVLRVVSIPGHTADAIALLDTRTGTLLSGDCLQLFGIFGSGHWGANITLPAAHFEALDRLAHLPLTAIYPAHDYHPEGNAYVGAEAIRRALCACREPLLLIRDRIAAAPTRTDCELADEYNRGNLPTVGRHVFAAVRRELMQSVQV